MDSQTLIRSELLKAIEKKRKHNPLYEQKQFAKEVGYHPDALSHLLCGGRRISKKSAKRYFGKVISLKQWDRIDHQFEIENGNVRLYKKHEPNPEMSDDQYQITADPLHSALLWLSDTEGFKSDPQWMALTLDEPVENVKEALDRLVRVGVMQKVRTRYRQTGAHYETTDMIPNQALVDRRKRLLKRVHEALNLPSSERDFYDFTCTLDKRDIPRLKKEIRRIVRGFEKAVLSSPSKAVYTFFTSLFPMQK